MEHRQNQQIHILPPLWNSYSCIYLLQDRSLQQSTFWPQSDSNKRLQHVQNSAARPLTGTRKQEHITPVLKELHWLPVTVRIRFKILLMTFKCLNLLAPRYLTDLLTAYKPSRSLRSSTKHLLVQPCCNLKTYGERAFSVAAPRLWNALPLNIRNCKTITTFKSALKTHLFKSYFEP